MPSPEERKRHYLKHLKSKRLAEGKEARILGPILFRCYGMLRGRKARALIRRIVLGLEGGELVSLTIRRIFAVYYHREIGLFTGDGAFGVYNFTPTPPGTSIGKFCSIAHSAYGFNANHPINLKSSHAIFFNSVYKFADKDALPRNKLVIGNDVWLGHNSTILPGVTSIGDGAIIGANCTIFQNVPPYAIVAGNPGRVVRYRFPEATIAKLLEEKWWDQSFEKILEKFDEFQTPMDGAEGIYGAARGGSGS